MQMKENGSVSDYNILEKLASTDNEIIYKALCKETQQLVAIKEMFVKIHENCQYVSNSYICKHPNLLNYYSCFRSENFFYIVMELCSGSFDQIIKYYRPLTENETSAVLRRVLEGLICFSANNFKNRTNNVNPQNIFFDSNNEIKISQFETNLLLGNSLKEPFWMSPESITGFGSDCRSDIWSLGITAITLITGKMPYKREKDKFRFLKKIIDDPPPNPPPNSSQEFKMFVSKCLKKEISERPTANELINDPFITSVSELDGKKLINELIESYLEIKPNIEEYEEEEEEEEENED